MRISPFWRAPRRPAYAAYQEANTVNTMPEQTLESFADHGAIIGDAVSGTADSAQKVFDQLEAIGVDLTAVFLALEQEGVDTFEKAWGELLAATKGQLDSFR